MRFLHVLESLAPGGMETTFLNALLAFRTSDPSIEHHVLAFAGGALEGRYREASSSLTIGCSDETLDACLAAPHHLVHLLFERCAYRLMPQLLGHSRAAVVYGKGYDMGSMSRLNDGFTWQADESMLAAASRATFTTAALAGGFRVPGGRTTVLRKAADVRRFAALAAPDWATPLRITCVANLHPRKRLGDLIMAFRVVRQSEPRAELRLIGGGNRFERARLGQVAVDLGVAEHVSFAGLVQDVRDELARARIIALPSSSEGVPTAILEGMAAGRPVVATRVGHVESIVDDGVEGFLVDVGDVAGMADRLTRLLTNPAVAHAMGLAARSRAMHHDVAHVAKDLLDALRATAVEVGGRC